MRSRIWVLLLSLAVSALAADEQLPQRSDFAWGMELKLGESQPFYRLRLPLEVYSGVVRADLGDLRVLNGQGRVVPQQLLLPPRQSTEAAVAPAKIFPLYGPREAGLDSISIRVTGGDASGVKIETHGADQSEPDLLRGYILQLDDEPPRALRRLKLSWRPAARGFVHRLKVEYSRDLEHWRTQNPAAVVADLHYAGERLLKQTIPLGDIQAKYLRLSPSEGTQLVELSRASVEFAGEFREPELDRLPLDRVEPGEQAGEYRFELPGPLTLVDLDILPAEQNTLVRVKLFSRVDDEHPWVRRGGGLIYKLQAEGGPIRQTRLALERSRDRYWRLQVDNSGGGFGAVQPEFVLGWLPDELLFAARGEPPFTLVYGSGRVGPVTGDALLSGLDHEMRDLISEKVRLGPRIELAGSDVLSTRVAPDWKRWTLWGVLLLGTVLLGWMAWSTLRRLND